MREYLERFDEFLKKNPPPMKRSVFQLGIIKGDPTPIHKGGTCRACTNLVRLLLEYKTKNESKVGICSRCSDEWQARFRKKDALSRALPGSYGSQQ